MRALIVGSGYVGSALGAELLRQGHEVLGVRRTAGPGGEAGGVKVLGANITRLEELRRLPRGFDWVVNCAGASTGGEADYRDTYVVGNRNAIAWLAEGPHPAKYVYTSSTSVYGQTDGAVVTEGSPAIPPVATGKVLVEAEQVVIDAARALQFPAVVLRLAGIYGPGRGYWFKRFVAGDATIEGTGDRILNMVHREDVAGAIIAALRSGRPGEIYNTVDDEPVTQRGFFEWLSQQLNKPLPPSAPENPEVNRRRGATNKRVSNEKLKAELGYQFRYPTFREGYASEIQSLRG